MNNRPGDGLVEGEYYSTGSSIIKLHKIHKSRFHDKWRCYVDITVYAPNGSSTYAQQMPLERLRTLIPMGPHLAEVLYT